MASHDPRATGSPNPGSLPERALPKLETAAAQLAEIPTPPDTIASLLSRAAQNLALNPWRHRCPFFITAQPARRGTETYLVDTAGDALPWATNSELIDIISVISGGHAIPLAGEWDGQNLHLHSAADNSDWFILSTS